MKKVLSITIVLLVVLISACSNDNKTISTTEKITSKVKYEPKIKYSSSIIIDNTDMVMYPLNLNDGDNDSYIRSAEANYWNLIFYNVNSGKSELLTYKKLIINSFKIGHNESGANSSASFSDQFIYYEIINSDYNGDKKLTGNDPKKLFISNLQGKSFHQISPKNYSIYTWKIDNKHDLILMNLIKDSNGDKEFNEKDDVEYFIYNLKAGNPAKPIFDDAFKKGLRALAKKVL
ncbi:hypothetical protein EZ449_09655 [Pedobacter frigidisoli]|uniref:Lipoprotein n=1 Tax=Pedobacter frigidisoli TaxID=2530455 RepID=A0A4R0P291_9SPHI|nr:hypothetical protein [Pedobacter frigidisoli]TCD10600.1 hypothetical protein EZ449_09655 [Pedobacter frigidisoli]